MGGGGVIGRGEGLWGIIGGKGGGGGDLSVVFNGGGEGGMGVESG